VLSGALRPDRLGACLESCRLALSVRLPEQDRVIFQSGRPRGARDGITAPPRVKRIRAMPAIQPTRKQSDTARFSLVTLSGFAPDC
jgi:hypothetical protein